MHDRAFLRGVEARLRVVEERTGVQVVVAAIERADVYHGLRWRAFAFAAAVCGAIVGIGGAALPEVIPAPVSYSGVAIVLAAGLLGALAATLSPGVSRLFLEPLRAQAEVRQRAALLFLERELFATRDRTAVLLLACDFERQAVVLADTGFRGRVSDGDWQSVADTVSGHLRAGRLSDGLFAGLDALERLLLRRGCAPAAGDRNELPDRPVTAPGPS